MDELENLKRRDLQKLCKSYGLKANGKNTELIERLKEYLTDKEGNVEEKESTEIDEMDVDETEQVEEVVEEKPEVATKKNNVAEKGDRYESAHQQEFSKSESLVDYARKRAKKESSKKTEVPSFMSPTKSSMTHKKASLFQVVKKNDNDTKNINENKPVEKPPTHSAAPSSSLLQPTKSFLVKKMSEKQVLQKKQTNTSGPSWRKFDMKASLKRPISYKMKTGKLQPFVDTRNETLLKGEAKISEESGRDNRILHAQRHRSQQRAALYMASRK